MEAIGQVVILLVVVALCVAAGYAVLATGGLAAIPIVIVCVLGLIALAKRSKK